MKTLIRLSCVVVAVAAAQFIFAGAAAADALTISCQSAPASTISNPIPTNQPVVFTATATGGVAPYAYSWFGACVDDANNPSCTNSFSSAGNFTAYITATDSSGESQTASCSAYVRQACSSRAAKQCVDNAVYWFDSCGNKQDLYQACSSSQTCSNGACAAAPASLSATCFGSPNPATANQNVNFTANASGGAGNYLYNWSGACSGTSQVCTSIFPQSGTQTANLLVTSGTQTAVANCSVAVGAAAPSCAPRSSQKCVGNNLFWFDSCGSQQEIAQYCQNGCSNNACNQTQASNITVSKTVRNLSSGSGWSNTAAAMPGDVLMFMITLQPSGGGSANNVAVRDYFPSNLIYFDQMVVSGASNYSGDILSGLNFPSIPASQTITITYQARVAPASSFNYGSSTLTNNVSVTSPGGTYNPTSNASVVVVKSAVSGATNIPTGAGRNILFDSFIIPIIMILSLLWVYKYRKI